MRYSERCICRACPSTSAPPVFAPRRGLSYNIFDALSLHAVFIKGVSSGVSYRESRLPVRCYTRVDARSLDPIPFCAPTVRLSLLSKTSPQWDAVISLLLSRHQRRAESRREEGAMTVTFTAGTTFRPKARSPVDVEDRD
jgi:hypothetical protein